jgi:hypothetical protein
MKDSSLKSNEKFLIVNLTRFPPQEIIRLIKEDLGMLTESDDNPYNDDENGRKERNDSILKRNSLNCSESNENPLQDVVAQ